MTSKSDTAILRHSCELAMADSHAWQAFRALPGLRLVIENFEESYLDGLLKHIPDSILIPKLFEGDIGEPPKIRLPDSRWISPVMLRYAVIAQDLGRRFQMHGAPILEIGCGFGGQCKVIRDFYEPGPYLAVDLPCMRYVAGRYLAQLHVEAHLGSRDEFEWLVKGWAMAVKDPLVISNYALAECYRQEQDRYIDGLAPFKRGYVLWNRSKPEDDDTDNSPEEAAHRIELVTRVPVKIEPENPPSGPSNALLTWGGKSD